MTLSYNEELDLIRLKRELEAQRHQNKLEELDIERGNIRLKRAAVRIGHEQQQGVTFP